MPIQRSGAPSRLNIRATTLKPSQKPMANMSPYQRTVTKLSNISGRTSQVMKAGSDDSMVYCLLKYSFVALRTLGLRRSTAVIVGMAISA